MDLPQCCRECGRWDLIVPYVITNYQMIPGSAGRMHGSWMPVCQHIKGVGPYADPAEGVAALMGRRLADYRAIDVDAPNRCTYWVRRAEPLQPLPNGKVCSQCEAHKPLTEFGKNAKGKYGRTSACSLCTSAARRLRTLARNPSAPSYRPPKGTGRRTSDGTSRVCVRCAARKDLGEFGKQSSAADGRSLVCSRCAKAESLAQYLETHTPRSGFLTSDGSSKICSTCLVRKPLAEYNRHNKTKDKLTARCRQCHAVAMRTVSARRRARKAGVACERVDYTEIAKRDQWVCQICRRPVSPEIRWPDPQSGSIDHIVPVSKGGAHLRSNIQLAHLACNMKKHANGGAQTLLFG